MGKFNQVLTGRINFWTIIIFSTCSHIYLQFHSYLDITKVRNHLHVFTNSLKSVPKGQPQTRYVESKTLCRSRLYFIIIRLYKLSGLRRVDSDINQFANFIFILLLFFISAPGWIVFPPNFCIYCLNVSKKRAQRGHI